MPGIRDRAGNHMMKRTMRMGMDGCEAVDVWRIHGDDQDALMQELFHYDPVQWLGYYVTSREEHSLWNFMLVDNVAFTPAQPESPPADASPVHPWMDATITYKGALLVNNFPANRPGDPPPPPGTTLTYEVEAGAEMLTIPGHGFQWTLPGKNGDTTCLPDVNPGIVVPTLNHTYTWHNIEYPPWDTWRDAIGHVNMYSFAGNLYESTILFTGYSASRTFGPNEVELWTASLHFTECIKKWSPYGNSFQQTFGWNHFYRTDRRSTDPPWQQIVIAGTGQLVYNQADFMSLFRVA